jgi:integrase
MGRKRTGQIKEISEGKFELRIQTRKKNSRRGDFFEVYEGKRENAAEYLAKCLEKLIELEKNPEKAKNVSELCRIYIDREMKQKVEERTLLDYEKNLRLYIQPLIGEIPITDFRAKDGRDFIEKLSIERKLERPTIRKPFLHLRGAFDYALEREWIDKNPLTSVKTPKGGTVKEKNIPTINEQILIFEKCPTLKQKALWMTAYFTGMRPEEYLALRWSDIDFEKKLFKISRVAVQLKDVRVVFKKTKTTKSSRMQPMNAELAKVLKEYRKEWLAQKISQGAKWSNLDNEPDIVFCTGNGNVYLNSNLNRDLKKLLQFINGHDSFTKYKLKMDAKRKGIKYVEPQSKNLINENLSPYSMRHAFATHLLEAGSSLKDVSDLLGHSSIRVTADTYLHISEERKTTQVDRLESMILAKMAG